MFIKRLRDSLNKYPTLFANFSYITMMQVFVLLAPLITYPYLVRVLGTELYGYILSAQMLASYASLIINFGSNEVCAKHISINRNDKSMLSEIVNSVLCVRGFIFIAGFAVYFLVVYLVHAYRSYSTLFLITYLLTLNEVLFPQFFFQGIERMKYITIISIATKLFFIVLVFILVKDESDYLLVPVLYAAGYSLGAIISLFIIYNSFGLSLYIPQKDRVKIYVKDSSAVFATDLVCTVKDKVNYLLVGSFVGMQSLVVYDLGLKFISILTKPMQIISIVMFPRSANNHSSKNIKKIIAVSFVISLVLVVLLNVFMEPLAFFFLHENVDLLPIRLLSLAPVFLSVSSIISSNVFVAWGYNKYVLYSILITTGVYVITLLILFLLYNLASVYSFVALALISYLTEFIYRISKLHLIFHENK